MRKRMKKRGETKEGKKKKKMDGWMGGMWRRDSSKKRECRVPVCLFGCAWRRESERVRVGCTAFVRWSGREK